ncbi:MAG: hypothetical protein IJD21_03750 [Oscillospiraceae bacterium]|nr:hypothetical protein [Oscillospiraceae bacterium]
MDIKKKIEEIVTKLMKDEKLRRQFEKDPVSALEKLLGIDLPNDQLDQLVTGIKAKLAADSIGDMLGGLGGLFKK